MIYDYRGNFQFEKNSIIQNALTEWGVYYCGYITSQGTLKPLYIGRAIGEDVTIRSRLLEHKSSKFWPDVTSFGFQVCTTKSEAEKLEQDQIKKFQPKYNQVGKI